MILNLTLVNNYDFEFRMCIKRLSWYKIEQIDTFVRHDILHDNFYFLRGILCILCHVEQVYLLA